MSKAAKAAKGQSRVAGLTVIMVIVALLALMSAPALAHHKDGHDGGPPDDRPGNSSEQSPKDDEVNESNDGDADDATDPNEDDDDNAHPSGKDRSREPGGSGNQGRAQSDPDDDGRGPDRSNGGPDKPGGSGGVDAADQDGNNGCGNDDDFEDDNEGWCGGKPKPVRFDDHKPSDEVKPDIVHQIVCPAGTDKSGQRMDDLEDCDEDDVLGRTDEAEPKPLDEPDDVLGNVVRRSAPEVAGAAAASAAAPAAAVLPFTGADMTVFAGIALGLILVGLFALRARRES